MVKQGVKEKIVTAASKLFYFDGYNQTGINKILQEANVSKDSMYRYFRSKEDIAVVYLQERHIMWIGELMDFVKGELTGKEKIIAAFDYLNDWLVKVDFRGCGFQNIICDLNKEQQKINNQVVLHKNSLRDWIHNHLKNEISKEKATLLGDEILVLMEGAIILSQIQKQNWPIKTAKRTCVTLLT